jgi:hypothetical protein
MDNSPPSPTQSKRGKPLQKFDLELVEKLAARGLSYKQLTIAASSMLEKGEMDTATYEEIEAHLRKPLLEYDC